MDRLLFLEQAAFVTRLLVFDPLRLFEGRRRLQRHVHVFTGQQIGDGQNL